jgi:hypothetical protein
MSRRSHPDNAEQWAHQQEATEDLPLFGGVPERALPAGHARELGEAGRARTTAANGALLDALIPVAQQLAARGRVVTVTDVRKEAFRVGILTGKETRGQLSALGSLMKAAGLVPTGNYRASDLNSTHARPQVMWRLPTRLDAQT